MRDNSVKMTVLPIMRTSGLRVPAVQNAMRAALVTVETTDRQGADRSSSMGLRLAIVPAFSITRALASRVNAPAASENLRVLERLQRQLHSNVQEALALEVGLLQLKLG